VPHSFCLAVTPISIRRLRLVQNRQRRRRPCTRPVFAWTDDEVAIEGQIADRTLSYKEDVLRVIFEQIIIRTHFGSPFPKPHLYYLISPLTIASMLLTTRFFLLYQLFLFASVLASVTNSDTFGRFSIPTRYRVTPTDPHNATKIAETERLLKQQYGDTDVQTIPDENNRPTWLITSQQDNIDASLKQIDGVSTVTMDTPATITKREGGGGPKQSDLAKPPASRWNILATTGSDIKKTEAFLRTKIEPGTNFFEAGLEGYERCWGNVTLTDAAKAEVEKYEGVAGMGPVGELIALIAIPHAESPRRPPSGTVVNKGLTDRDTTQWQKQESPHWSLAMDSQYRYAFPPLVSLSTKHTLVVLT
jgi:hypothetical protein